MAISRRTFIGSAAAASAWGALSLAGARSAAAASPPGDVVGKITVGLPGLVRLRRRRRADQRLVALEPGLGPDAVAVQQRHQGLAGHARVHPHATRPPTRNLGNGQPATLFSSYDQQTVDTHFLWMQQNGCDTAALQRFNPNSSEGPTRDAMAAKVRSAAESHGAEVLHHVRRHRLDEHAVGDQGRLDEQDVRPHRVARLRAPERQTGRLHLGFRLQRRQPPVGRRHLPRRRSTGSRARAATSSAACRGNGAPATAGRGRASADVYHAFNMISPWMVGAHRQRRRAPTAIYQNLNVPDQADCNAHGIDYQPCVLPGDVSGAAARPRRLHVAPVLQHGPRRRAGHLHLDVRRVRRGQPDRQDRREPPR